MAPKNARLPSNWLQKLGKPNYPAITTTHRVNLVMRVIELTLGNYDPLYNMTDASFLL